MKRRTFVQAAAAASLVPLGTVVRAQGWPEKPVRLVLSQPPGSGPDADAASPGDGLLGHARALLDWVEALRTRHPGVVLEACSSGAVDEVEEELAVAFRAW